MSTPPSRIHALVTGGSRGIGRAIATQLAARGCRVGLQYRTRKAEAEEALAALAGTDHAVFPADLTDPAAPEALWDAATRTFGRIDLLINNAGVFEHHAPLEVDHTQWRDAWRRTVGANLLAPAELCYLAANAMVKAAPSGSLGRGRIVNISSRGAFRGEPNAPAYGASKAGLNALSQSLAKALAPKAVYVYCIAPGWVDTDMAADHLRGPEGHEILAQHPLGRVATADEIAAAAVFCALDAPATMTGAIIDVNGASYLRT